MADTGRIFGVAIACLIAGGAVGYGVSQMAEPKVEIAAAEQMTDKKVQDIVRNYILQNPETVVRALQGMQADAAAPEPTADLKDKQEQLYKQAGSPAIGAENADLTIVEFFDYHCGYCKRMYPVMKQLIGADKNIRVVFKELPILAPDSREAAKAALAVSRIDPEKYLAYHEKLMNHNARFSLDTLKQFATDIGVDPAALEKEMDATWVNDELNEVADLARSIGIQGTPALVVGDELVPGAIDFDALTQRIKIARELAKKS